MSMKTKTIGRMPTDHGPYDPQLAYGKKFQCTLFGCAWESLHDNNNTAPAVWDGGDTITPNLVDWKKVSGSYEAWLMNKDKPATTGTTGAYPYNGMGRVVLKKHIVDGVNTLTHEAFEDSEGNDRENTIYVIQYDFTLGADITIPDNCVLEFDGGSISGNGTGKDTITGTNTGIQAGLVKVFSTDIILDGSWSVIEAYPEWFGGKEGDNTVDNSVYINKLSQIGLPVTIGYGEYYCSTPIIVENVYFRLLGVLIYNGTSTNIEFLKFKNYNTNTTNNNIIDLNGKIYVSPSIAKYDEVNKTNISGVVLENCYAVTVNLGCILGFNTGLKLIGNNDGCTYNVINLGEIINANKCIELTSQGEGWVHENTINGGRVRCHSNFYENNYDCWGLYIAGISSINSIHIQNVCMEGFRHPIYLLSVQKSSFENIRTEGCDSFITTESHSFDIYARALVGTNKIVYIGGYLDALTLGSYKKQLAAIPISVGQTKTVGTVGFEGIHISFVGIGLGYRFSIKPTKIIDPNTGTEVTINDSERDAIIANNPTKWGFVGCWYNPNEHFFQSSPINGDITYSWPEDITEAEFECQTGGADMEVKGLLFDYTYPS